MSGSLFGRLLLTLAGSVVVLWLGAVWIAMGRGGHEIAAIHDRQLSQTAQVLLALAGHEIIEHLTEGAPTAPSADASALADLGTHLTRYAPEDGLAFHVQAVAAGFHFRSANFPSKSSPDGALPGYADLVADGVAWRIYTRQDETGVVVVQVAQRQADRDRLADGLVGELVPPLLVGLAVTLLLTVAQVQRARRPLAELAAALEARGPSALEPLELERPPREIAPIVAALDHLVQALRERIERERRFTADAAHELRTPLAAIQAGAEVALETDEPQLRREALEGLREGARRAARLVSQLLTLARLDHRSSALQDCSFELGACVESTMADLAHAAHQGRVELSLDERSPAPVDGSSPLVAVLVRNLIENAIRHAPESGSVQVTTRGDGAHSVLRVEDSGAGIPPGERERVFDRFYRATEHCGSGSGLGLSIVARVAALHGAQVELTDSPLGGLCATVRFPRARATPASGRVRVRE